MPIKISKIPKLSVEHLSYFLSRVEILHKDKCWKWKGNINHNGYGRAIIRVAKKTYHIMAHRIAFYFMHNREPEKMLDHLCHNRECCNPYHLIESSPLENQQNRKGATVLSKTGIRGVFWAKHAKAYRVRIQKNGKIYEGGYYKSIKSASEKAEWLIKNSGIKSTQG